jgi:two-component system chemotaxis response regulator CheY
LTAFPIGSYDGWRVKLPFDYHASILVVDDQPQMVHLIERYIRKIGFDNVEHTTDGAEALNMVRNKRYWVVISDLNMEPVGGLQLLRAVRSDESLRKTRFIMATGGLNTANVAAAKWLGVDTYLLKPFSRSQLETKLAELIGR